MSPSRQPLLFLAAGLLALFGLTRFPSMDAQTDPTTLASDQPAPVGAQVATLGGGCFWCLEALYQQVKGVRSVVSGYAGGHDPSPTYRDVCNGTTGHAEVVQVTFDPNVITYPDILELFWEVHDPTTLNRQGNDVGTQYRSIILYHNATQKKQAEAAIAAAQTKFNGEVTTELVPLDTFHSAEEYHQDYFARNPNVPYCAYVIAPKLQKFLKTNAQALK